MSLGIVTHEPWVSRSCPLLFSFQISPKMSSNSISFVRLHLTSVHGIPNAQWQLLTDYPNIVRVIVIICILIFSPRLYSTTGVEKQLLSNIWSTFFKRRERKKRQNDAPIAHGIVSLGNVALLLFILLKAYVSYVSLTVDNAPLVTHKPVWIRIFTSPLQKDCLYGSGLQQAIRFLDWEPAQCSIIRRKGKYFQLVYQPSIRSLDRKHHMCLPMTEKTFSARVDIDDQLENVYNKMSTTISAHYLRKGCEKSNVWNCDDI